MPQAQDTFVTFSDTKASLLAWFREQAMPLWSTTGTDWIRGGFVERLIGSGVPADEPRRTRVVARQIYVFSVAQKLGWQQDAQPWVEHGLNFLQQRLLREDGTYASSVTPEGRVVNAQFDLYEQAFALFALASAYRRAGQHQRALRARAEALLDVLEQRYAHPTIGFEESLPSTEPLRSNPHMHLLEATLQWAQTLGEVEGVRWWAAANQLVSLAKEYLIHPASGLVTELFDANWRPLAGLAGQAAEPGHQFEWGWLLARWARLSNDEASLQLAHRMISLAEQSGIDGRRGVAINEFDVGLVWRDANAKLWPQTERIKAWVACAELAQANHDPVNLALSLSKACLAMKGLLAYLQHPVTGGWQEVWRSDGSWQDEPIRASSLYHIVCALETVHDAAINTAP